MKVQTTRFGIVAANDDHLVHMPDGMIGFGACKQFIIVESQATPNILWLQSVDAPEIAFPLIEPQFFKKDFKTPLNEADKATLGYQENHRIKVFCVMTIPQDPEQMTVNLKAPLVINITNAKASQVILQDKTLELRVPAFELFQSTFKTFTRAQQSVPAGDADDQWTPVAFRGESARDLAL